MDLELNQTVSETLKGSCRVEELEQNMFIVGKDTRHIVDKTVTFALK